MIYRKLGNTGINISSLGFGCMRLPMVEKNGKKEIEVRVRGILKKYRIGKCYLYIYGRPLCPQVHYALRPALKHE